ncbi:hypothetical protein D3C86_1550390 [compost metagenome]
MRQFISAITIYRHGTQDRTRAGIVIVRVVTHEVIQVIVSDITGFICTDTIYRYTANHAIRSTGRTLGQQVEPVVLYTTVGMYTTSITGAIIPAGPVVK